MMFGENTGAADTLERIPEGSVGVELGVWLGDTSEKFLTKARHLHLVDPWSVEPYRKGTEWGEFQAYLKRYVRIVGTDDPRDYQRLYDRVYEQVAKRFDAEPVTIHRCTSAQFFAKFDEMVDWVYVDAQHTYNGCYFDLVEARRICKVIYGDDYGNRPEVKRAVDDFVRVHNLPFEAFGLNQYQIEVRG